MDKNVILYRYWTPVDYEHPEGFGRYATRELAIAAGCEHLPNWHGKPGKVLTGLTGDRASVRYSAP